MHHEKRITCGSGIAHEPADESMDQIVWGCLEHSLDATHFAIDPALIEIILHNLLWVGRSAGAESLERRLSENLIDDALSDDAVGQRIGQRRSRPGSDRWAARGRGGVANLRQTHRRRQPKAFRPPRETGLPPRP